MAKQDMKEKYMEYQLLVQRIQQLQENISVLEAHLIDLVRLRESLDSVSQIKLDQDTLIPLGGGIFLRGILKDNKNVVMAIGSNIFIDKNLDDAKITVNKQLEEVNYAIKQLEEEGANLNSKAHELQTEFQNMRENALED